MPIIKIWHGELLLQDSDEAEYLFRIILPNENKSEIIGVEIFEDDF